MNKWIYLILTFGIVGLIVYALSREVERNENLIKSGISGVLQAEDTVMQNVLKTDNAHILLLDPLTYEPLALNTINPFVPPITFSIGQEHAFEGKKLEGSYRLLVLTDKDGKLEMPKAGEIIGEITEPIPLGTEKAEYVMNQFFQGLPPQLVKSFKTDTPEKSVSGKVLVAENLKSQVSGSDRLVILLFDPQTNRPVAFKILPSFQVGQEFTIGESNSMGGQAMNGKYSLRILTDKNNQPFQSTEGEIIGRSKELIALGSKNIELTMDEPYKR